MEQSETTLVEFDGLDGYGRIIIREDTDSDQPTELMAQCYLNNDWVDLFSNPIAFPRRWWTSECDWDDVCKDEYGTADDHDNEEK